MAVETDYDALVARSASLATHPAASHLAEELRRSSSSRSRCAAATSRQRDRQTNKRYADTFRAALVSASVKGEVRPFHDGRHTSITNAAAAGVGPGALQPRAGHSDLSTTQRYIDLAGVLFRDEADVAEARMFGIVAPVEEDG